MIPFGYSNVRAITRPLPCPCNIPKNGTEYREYDNSCSGFTYSFLIRSPTLPLIDIQ
jgi:hypothetical protein